MTTTKQVLGTLVALAIMGGVAFAATTPTMSMNVGAKGSVTMHGTVASVSGSTVTVTSWFGPFAVNTANAKLLRRYDGTAQLSEFLAGDEIIVTGTASQTAPSITATKVQDMSIQTLNVHPNGVVSNVSTTAGTLTLTVASKVYKVSTSSSTLISVNGATGTLNDLSVSGARATIYGVLDRTQTTVMATKIVGKVPKTSGTATSTRE